MALFDTLILAGITIVIGGSVGIGISKIFVSYQKRQDRNKALKFIEGKLKNNLKLDGELINVDKFSYKEADGNMQSELTLANIVEKNQPQDLKEGKKGSFWRFWKKKEKEVEEKQKLVKYN